MRPPLLTEQAVRAAVREVAASGARITGVAVRRVLAKRFGARGGVSRIYRLLREVQDEGRPTLTSGAPLRGPVDSDETREAAIERANLAEHRERAHQERWARETDALRIKLATAEQAAKDAESATRRIADLTRALASAQARIDELERQRLEP